MAHLVHKPWRSSAAEVVGAVVGEQQDPSVQMVESLRSWVAWDEDLRTLHELPPLQLGYALLLLVAWHGGALLFLPPAFDGLLADALLALPVASATLLSTHFAIGPHSRGQLSTAEPPLRSVGGWLVPTHPAPAAVSLPPLGLARLCSTPVS